jgi:MFS family permease
MHTHSLERWRHEHVFLGAEHDRNERRTWLVIALTGAMMIGEIVAGIAFGSMALLADGWHMATHAAALGISATAYAYARRHARDPRFTFGTGKLGDLAGFASAVVLAMVALLIGYESVARLLHPVPIAYGQAVAIAALGLGFVLVPESSDPEPGAFDVPGAGMSVAALTALVFAVIEAPEWGWTDPRILGCFGAALALGAGFIAWELRTAQPMLDLSFFRNRRFSVASAGMSIAFFSLFGATFAMTQFLQDVQGYSPLEAGAAQIPLAFGLLAGAGSSVKLSERFGTTRVVTAGLVLLSVLLGSAVLWHAGMPYLPLGLWFFAVAVSLGWIAGPATDSVMGAVPEEKSGVASAMNDVTRQVGGALGTAVIGSLITTLFDNRVADGVPAPDAFTDAMGTGFLIAGAVAVVAAVAVKLWLPARHEPPSPVGLASALAADGGTLGR